MKASALVPLALLVGPACTAKNPAYEKQLAQLNENIVILQSERDRLEERIAVLEAERESALQVRPPVPGTLERPPLKVVQLAPPSSEQVRDPNPEQPAVAEADPAQPGATAAAPQDSTERVLIQGSGQDISQVVGQP